eukprot:1811263-Pleurochrysis_carterae.AAC.3
MGPRAARDAIRSVRRVQRQNVAWLPRSVRAPALQCTTGCLAHAVASRRVRRLGSRRVGAGAASARRLPCR